MNFNVVARKTSIKEPFRMRVQTKLAKLDRFFDETANAVVTVTNEHERETVEVTILSGDMYYRVEKTTYDRFDSLEAVVDALVRLIVKNKTKLEKRLRDAAFDPVYRDDEQHMPDDYEDIRVKNFIVKPMTVDEAILQMNMLDHEFFVFLNAESDKINVTYKRKNGKYGVLDPQIE